MSDDNIKSPDITGNGRAKNLKRRSSIQKIIHICNQSYQVFPHVFLWVQDFHSSLHSDLRKIIPFIKSFLVLRLAVYLCIAVLSVELFCLFMVTVTFSVPTGFPFFLGCISILSAMACQIFNLVAHFRKALRGTFFVKKKVQ